MAIHRPAVFFDRDGTLNELVPDSSGEPQRPLLPEQIVLRRQAAPFVRSLNEMGYLCVVVTNQPALARGTLSPQALCRIHERLERELAHNGAALAGVHVCPHDRPGAADRSCPCRMPAPGLILEAAAAHDVDVRRSWMVGTGLADIEAGRRAGVGTILVTPHADRDLADIGERPQARPDRVAVDLVQAARIIAQHREDSLGRTASGVD